LATFGEGTEEPKLGGIPSRGGKALPPPRKIGAHACFTKIGQEPDLIANDNRAFVPNYGERYRQGKTIATSLVESAVNQVISKRFVKKQQMRWAEAGAHRLLQIRIQVLNEDWRGILSRWYPGLQATSQAELKAA
jgi:hypothetical protein